MLNNFHNIQHKLNNTEIDVSDAICWVQGVLLQNIFLKIAFFVSNLKVQLIEMNMKLSFIHSGLLYS
jgi:hypothetical protein